MIKTNNNSFSTISRFTIVLFCKNPILVVESIENLKFMCMKSFYHVLFFLFMCFTVNVHSQSYSVPVNEYQEKMKEGKFQPNWESL